jgi:DNA-binding NtrC family response regulator
MSRVLSYQWPGNVRELENCVRYLTCLQLSRPIVPNDLPLLDLPSDGKVSSPMTASAESSINSWNVQRPLREAKRELVRRFEREYLDQALRATHGNIASAARRSGKARRAFFELMRKHGINAADYNGAVAVPMPERKVEAAGLVAPEIRSDGSGDAATDLRRELRHQVPSSGVFQ